jgi:Clp protease
MDNSAKILIAAVIALGLFGIITQFDNSVRDDVQASTLVPVTTDAKPKYARVKNEMLLKLRFVDPVVAKQKDNTFIYRFSLINDNPDITITGIKFQTTSHFKNGSFTEAGIKGKGELDDDSKMDFWLCKPSSLCKNAIVIKVTGELHKGLSRLELTPVAFTGYPLRDGVFVNASSYGNNIYLIGEISGEWINEIQHAITDSSPVGISPTVFLNSPGGDVGAAFEIGRIVRKAQARVVVHNTCASACVMVLGAGWTRSVHGKIGIHRPYLSRHDNSAGYTDIQSQMQNANATLKQYLAEMNMPLALLDAMNAVPPNQIRWLNDDQVEQFQLNQTDSIAQELMDDHQAKRYGISRRELYRREQVADRVCGIEQGATALGIWEATGKLIECRMRVLASGR